MEDWVLNKSNVAYLFTCRSMAKGLSSLYFWTFTLPAELDISEAISLWNYLLTELRRSCDFRRGVRVFELHPGGHGLHVHCLMTRYFDVHDIRRRCRQCGWGRVHVKRVLGIDSQIDYVGKYLSKMRPVELKGVRLWSTLGLPNELCSRVRDILFEGTTRSLAFRLVTDHHIRAVAGSFAPRKVKLQIKLTLANKEYYRLMLMSQDDFDKVKLAASIF